MIPNSRGGRGPRIIRYLPILIAIIFFVVVGVRAGCQSEGMPLEPEISSENPTSVEAVGPVTETAQSGGDVAADRERDPRDARSGNRLQVHFIDVGQGDAILIMGESANILIDGGPRAAGDSIVNYLHERGIEFLDLIVASHPHEDHIGGVLAVFEHFPVNTVLDAGVPHTTATFDRYLTHLERLVNEGDTRYLTAEGQTLTFGNVTVEVLGPASEYDCLNDNSVVCRVTFDQISFLFTGDMEREAELDLLRSERNIEADVLKVSHHGSSSSTSDEFLRAVSPAHAVICVGEDNPYGHPSIEVLERLSGFAVRVHRTDSSGTLVFESDGDSVTVSDERDNGHRFNFFIARATKWITTTISAGLGNPFRW
ncbi:MAG: ComEC/Rec2 family competence protein [Bacillota bacterium]